MKNLFKKLISGMAAIVLLASPLISFAQATVALPPQPGNANKFLQTDGLNLRWANGGGGGGGGVTEGAAITGCAPNEVIYSDNTNDVGCDPLFTRNQTTEEFSVAGALGASPFDISTISLGTALGGGGLGASLNYVDNGGTNGQVTVFAGDATVGSGEPIIGGISADNGAPGDLSSISVVPTDIFIGVSDGVVFTEMAVNKNLITYQFDGTNIIDFFSPTKGTIILGDGAGNQTMTGEDNLVFGGNSDGFENAGQSLTTGEENVFMGKGTGRLMTASSRNVIIGSSAGSNTGAAGTVSDNVIIGRGTGSSLGLSSGSAAGNVLIGQGTGTGINANYNVAIGYQAMGSSTGTGNIAIGPSALASNTSGINIGIGDTVGQLITTGSGNILVGSIAGTSLLTNSSNNTIIGFQAGVQNEGQRNSFYGSGSGGSVLGDDNVAVGYLALNGSGTGADVTVTQNTAVGTRALTDPRTGSSNNTVMGYNAMFAGTTSNNTTIIGAESGDALTTGSFNTMLGASAGGALTLGAENTFIGMGAASSMTGLANISSGNVIQGMFASVDRTRGNFNTIIGTRADQAVSTGDSNTILGYSAGFGLTTGASNIMIGAVAGANVTSGQGIFIGVGADSFFAGTGMIALGSSATTTASNQMVVGSTATPVNNYFFGRGVLTGTPGDITFNASGATGGTIAAGDYIFTAGASTGLAQPGSFRHQTSVPTSVSAVTLQTLGDRSVILGDYTTLDETVATSVVRVGVPLNTVAGGTILVTVQANDATDFQSRTLEAQWSAVNKAGTITTGLSTPVEAIATSAGTLTCTLTAVDAGGNNADFDLDCTSSLTQTTLRANAQVLKNFGTGAIIAQ